MTYPGPSVIVQAERRSYVAKEPESACSLRRSAALTEFQAAMYFSMHWVTHVVSLFDMLLPGLGMHFSKQCSLTFCRYLHQHCGSSHRAASQKLLYLKELLGVGFAGLEEHLLNDGLLDRFGVHGFGGD